MFAPDRITAARRWIARLHTNSHERGPEFESRKGYAQDYLQYLIVDDTSLTPRPDRQHRGVRSREAQKIEKKLIQILTGVNKRCSRCRAPLSPENSSEYAQENGGRCSGCETRYYHDRTKTEPTYRIPVPARVWDPFRSYCLDLGRDPLMEVKLLIASATGKETQ